MSKEKQEKYEIPLILYEEPSSRGEKGIPFPYIEVQKDKNMPPFLFIFEYKYTGEVEPDENGKEAAIVDQIPHKYIDMEYLQEKLSPELNDKVRVAIGLKPLQTAKQSGQEILDRVFAKVNDISAKAKEDRDEKVKELQKKKENERNGK